MKLRVTTLASVVKRSFQQVLIGLLMTVSLWQGIAVSMDNAIAAPIVVNSKASIVDRAIRKEKAEEQKVEEALKDGNQPVKQSLDKAKEVIEKEAEQLKDAPQDLMEKSKSLLDK
jgi:FtsZ-binding cell division protein ZapB